MGLITSIAEKTAVSAASAASAAFPPAVWLLKTLAGIERFLCWWFGSLSRVLATIAFAFAVLSLHFWVVIQKRERQIAVQREDFVAQQERARQIAENALHHQNAISAANAAESDRKHSKELADAQVALDEYVAANRFRPARQLQPSGAEGAAGVSSPAQNSGDPAVLAGMPADAVLVSAGDLQKCTEASSYAIDAHNWSLTINQVK